MGLLAILQERVGDFVPFDSVAAIADAEVEFELGEIDYRLPELAPDAIRYLSWCEEHRGRLELEARKVAAGYGSRFTDRRHVVIALRIRAGTWPIDRPEDGEGEEEEGYARI